MQLFTRGSESPEKENPPVTLVYYRFFLSLSSSLSLLDINPPLILSLSLFLSRALSARLSLGVRALIVQGFERDKRAGDIPRMQMPVDPT